MNKEKILAAMLLTGTTVMGMTGMAGAESVDEIMQKNREASKEITSGAYDIDMAADVTLNIINMGMTVNLKGSGDLDVKLIKEPMALEVSGLFSYQALGNEGKVDVGAYLVTEDDGTVAAYGGTDGNWTSVQVDSETLKSYTDILNGDDKLDYSSAPIMYELAEATENVNGAECYVVETTLTWEDVKNLIEWSYEQEATQKLMGEIEEDAADASAVEDIEEAIQSLDEFDEMLDCLKLNIHSYIDRESYIAKKVSIDMEGSDWTTLTAQMIMNGLITADNTPVNETKAEIDVKELGIDIVYNGDVDEITVPDSVKNTNTSESESEESTESWELSEGLEMKYKDVTISYDESEFENGYISENFISASVKEQKYDVTAYISEYGDAESSVRSACDWEKSYYEENAEEFDNAAVSEIDEVEIQGMTAYHYNKVYRDIAVDYAVMTQCYYVKLDEDRYIDIELSEFGDKVEDLKLTDEVAKEILGHITITIE